MSTVLTVFKKEMIDTLRDRRTLISAIVMPALAIPLLMYAGSKLMSFIIKKESSKKITIAMLDAPSEFADYVADLDTMYEIRKNVTLESGRDLILSDSLDVMIGFKSRFMKEQEDMKSSKVNMWYKSTNLMIKDRVTKLVDKYESGLLDDRINELGISKKVIDPINLLAYDIAPAEEQFGKTAGGFIPYLFIIFCFSGCMYPALDLITGEKERGTIETLLTVPASRFKILLGKVITIAVVGLAAALMGILGLVAAAKLLPDIPDDLMAAVSSMVSGKFILMLLVMLIPLCLFFSGMLSAMVIRAKTFKEAQSIVSPFMMVVVIPAALAVMPGIELNWKTAFIPILNIALATKEIVSGTIQINHYVAIVLSLVVIAIASVFFSYRVFSKEGTVLK